MDKALFQQDVQKTLSDGYYFKLDRTPVRGQAVSSVLSTLRDPVGRENGRHWKNLGGLGDFEGTLERNGFRIVKGKNKRGNPCRIVTVL